MERTVVAACMLLLGSWGCAKDCVEVCEERRGCSNASVAEQARECEAYCVERGQQVADSGCESPFDDFLSCRSSADACVRDACLVEADALDACVTPAN